MWSSMLPLLVRLSPALLLLLPDSTQEVGWEDYKHGRQGAEEKPLCSWKCLVFTLQWPAGFCQSLDNRSLCQIPENIDSWTIHGLWPVGVTNCCRCWPMFHSDVQELDAALTQHWPSLLKITSSFHFWRNEWEKHGVCAACVEGLNSPLRYFQLGIKLRRQFDVDKRLEDAGITPSCDRLYKVEEVRRVLDPLLGDKYEIQCVTDEQDRQVWFQVKTPLFRNLTLGCDHHGDEAPPSPGHPCRPGTPFYFLPIDHQQPERPCSRSLIDR